MAEFPVVINGVSQRLHKLADALHPAETRLRAEASALAEKVQHAQEDWHAKVDAWLEDDASKELEAVKREAFAIYRTLVADAHAFIERLRSKSV